MHFHEISFIILSAIIMIFSVLTVTSRKILRAATYLLFVLISTAGMYYWLQYEFMAGVQLALYAGGIVVIIIFSILLTHHIHHQFDKPSLRRNLVGFGIAGVGAALSIAAILSYDFKTSEAAPINVDVREIGLHLVNTGENGFALPFEVISVLLLAALIAAIVIAKKDKSELEQNQ